MVFVLRKILVAMIHRFFQRDKNKAEEGGSNGNEEKKYDK